MKLRGAALALLLTTQCMPPIRVSTAFASRFGDNDQTRLARVLERLPRERTPRNQGLLAAVLQGDRREVAVYDIATHRPLWSQALAASGTPEIVGDALVVETGHTTQLLDLQTGASRGQVEHTGLELTGAARDGDRVVLCFSSGLAGGGRRSGRVVTLDARSGGVRWEHELSGLLGRPAALGGLAFIPWDRQSIAVLDLATGVEQARLRSTDDVLSWVFAGDGGVWYGGRGLYHLTADSASGTRQGSGLLVNPLQGVPGDPMLYQDGFLATTGTRTARDHIRFGFLPRVGEHGRAALHDDAVYLAYYRHLLAVDVGQGTVRWAQRLEEDVESLTVTARGVYVTSGTGKVRGVDPRTGAVSVVAELNAPLGAIAADFDALAAPSGGARPDGSVREQLVGLVLDADNLLVPFRGWLVGLLAM
ncbi:MAG: PQQ-binding-like beta-propeller repeat protein, partial [Deltaproteobacteria bacterium]|nr:PQQ-binding-like beta-propeller repeat protein [Deltaproteobacteria bacterium]